MCSYPSQASGLYELAYKRHREVYRELTRRLSASLLPPLGSTHHHFTHTIGRQGVLGLGTSWEAPSCQGQLAAVTGGAAHHHH